MFDRYTEQARRALFIARFEANQRGTLSMNAEHFLLGIIRADDPLTTRIFDRSGLSPQGVLEEIVRRSPREAKIPMEVEIWFGVEAHRVIQLAAEEADRLRHDHIGTEHLLLGILRQAESLAGSLLIERGMRLNIVRESIRLLHEGTDASQS